MRRLSRTSNWQLGVESFELAKPIPLHLAVQDAGRANDGVKADIEVVDVIGCRGHPTDGVTEDPGARAHRLAARRVGSGRSRSGWAGS